MLSTFVTTTIILAAAMTAMALGAIVGARPLRHGCGETTTCEGCRRPCARDGHREDAT